MPDLIVQDCKPRILLAPRHCSGMLSPAGGTAMRGHDPASSSWRLIARSVRLREELHRIVDVQREDFPVYKGGLPRYFESLRARGRTLPTLDIGRPPQSGGLILP